ncbi:hypothetical protein [Serratia microhaemolytica]|uniref:hypothetical protein n=1 Tax=Serratia microhaemolytica TaxID=2675110 RepID=UPI000FDDB9F0|nr:hypothetical protein [Serratia microhaemolytica]
MTFLAIHCDQTPPTEKRRQSGCAQGEKGMERFTMPLINDHATNTRSVCPHDPFLLNPFSHDPLSPPSLSQHPLSRYHSIRYRRSLAVPNIDSIGLGPRPGETNWRFLAQPGLRPAM